MKRIFFFLLITFISEQTVLGSCALNSVDVFPGNNNITANSIFLITFTEQYYGFKENIKDFSFYGKTNKGKKISLKVKQLNFSGNQGQILLAPSKNFNQGDSISIFVEFSTKVNNDIGSEFKAYLEAKKWFVQFNADRQSPLWDSDSIRFKYENHQNSSTKGFEFIFSCNVTDNYLKILTYNISSFTCVPMLYEITFSGERSICSSVDLNARIYAIGCGWNFKNVTIQKDKIMSATIRPVDSSGNFGTPKTIIFGL